MKTLGLDIGGANLKAAHTDGGSCSKAFPLWKQPHTLADQLPMLARHFPRFDRVAVTMTADLCDCFESKRQGVNHVLHATEELAGARSVEVWSTAGCFVKPHEARDRTMECAAANWHALAHYVASLYPDGPTLLIDVGSTTTDIVHLRDGRVEAKGLTDTQRLTTGELLYLGVMRTPLAALGPTINFAGKHYHLMAELFATTHDVFLLSGGFPEQPSRTDTADGRPATRRCAAARVARMIGADLDMLSLDDASRLAQSFAMIVESRISTAVGQLASHGDVHRLIVSGSGAFVAERAVTRALPQARIVRLADQIGEDASAAACAYALVQLSNQSREAEAAEAPSGPGQKSISLAQQKLRPPSEKPPIHVIKMGGSLFDMRDLPQRFETFLQSCADHHLVLIAGGGRAADLVREFDKTFSLGEETGHWLAVRAMQLNTYLLAALLPRCRTVLDFDGCLAAWQVADVALIDPLRWLEDEEHTRGVTISHRWTCTSDSIAAHLAHQIGAPRLTLLKSVLPKTGGDIPCAARLGMVDEQFDHASKAIPHIEIVNLRADPPQQCVLR